MSRGFLVFHAAVVLLLAGCFGGGDKRTTTTTDSRYTRALQSRFYAAWEQPESVTAPRGRISVPVEVEIDGSGRVVRFKLAEPSGYREVDASIRAAGKRVRQVDPPPIPAETARLKLRINFDLDVKR